MNVLLLKIPILFDEISGTILRTLFNSKITFRFFLFEKKFSIDEI